MWLCGGHNACRSELPRDLPLVENEKYSQGDATEARGMIPLYFFIEIENREYGEYQQSDHFLNSLELRGAELIRANAVRRDLEAVFEKSDAPAHQNHLPESGSAELQVAIPGEGHEDIRDGEKDDRSHARYLLGRTGFVECKWSVKKGLQAS